MARREWIGCLADVDSTSNKENGRKRPRKISRSLALATEWITVLFSETGLPDRGADLDGERVNQVFSFEQVHMRCLGIHSGVILEFWADVKAENTDLMSHKAIG